VRMADQRRAHFRPSAARAEPNEFQFSSFLL